MKRYVSKEDEYYYTDMLKVIKAIGGKNLNYNFANYRNRNKYWRLF